MGEKKFYWLKLKDDFFKRHDVKIIESMDNGKEYILFYLKLLVESISHEGRLRFSDTIPYSEKMLATITDTNIDIVRTALQVFRELNLVEVLDDKTLYMSEVTRMIGSESASAERMRRSREKRLPSQCDALVTNGDADVQKSDTEIEIDRELETDLELEAESEQDNGAAVAAVPRLSCPFAEIQNLWNSICISYPKIQSIQGTRQKAVKARWNYYKSIDRFRELFEIAEASDFLKGVNNRNWSADFDWLMKADSFTKALEGKYSDRQKTQGGKRPQGTSSFDVLKQIISEEEGGEDH